jgi:hypothetical protein
MYTREEELDIYARIGVTERVLKLLKTEKRRLGRLGQKTSMAKLVCNLVLEKYEDKN